MGLEKFREGRSIKRILSEGGTLHPMLDFIALFPRECAKNEVDSGEDGGMQVMGYRCQRDGELR